MTNKEIEYHKRMVKIGKKYSNPKNLTLMQLQHEYAINKGFKSWSDFIGDKK